MTDHTKTQEYLEEAREVKHWTLYASVSFGALVVMANLIFMAL